MIKFFWELWLSLLSEDLFSARANLHGRHTWPRVVLSHLACDLGRDRK